MLTGRIGNPHDAELPGYWWARCDAVGACTQGRSREHALLMLADCIELLANERIKVTVTEIGPVAEDEIAVSITSDRPDLLAELVRQEERLMRKQR